MLSVVEIYNDVIKDTANTVQSGHLSYEMFSRLSRRAELQLIDWLTGDVADQRPPFPYLTQKNKDWLAHLITPFKVQPVEGVFTRPVDYYQWDNLSRLGAIVSEGCEEEDKQDLCNTPIEILDGQQFDERCNTYIEELKVSLKKPVCKMVGKEVQIAPKDIGSVKLEYIRFPKFASIVPKNDPVFNDEVPDIVVDYEWDERAREFLIWFISDSFANHTREQALKQMNILSNPKQ